MSQISIAFNVQEPRFRFAFIWEGDEAAVAEVTEAIRGAALSQSLSEKSWIVSCVVNAPALLPDPDETVREMAMMGIVSFVLQAKTGNRAHPGMVRDYLPVSDFDVTFTNVADGRITMNVQATPNDGLAGSA